MGGALRGWSACARIVTITGIRRSLAGLETAGAVVPTQEGSYGVEHHTVMWVARAATAAGALLAGLLGNSLTWVALMAVLLALVVGQLVAGVCLRIAVPRRRPLASISP